MKYLNVHNYQKALISAVFAAVLYSICIPCSKLIGNYVQSAMLGAFLYLGAGIGFLIFMPVFKNNIDNSLTKRELPYILAMIFLDISAIILLMIGISKTNSANVSLLVNFELAATTLFAFILFKESIKKKLWIAIILIILAGIILSFDAEQSLTFNFGSILVILSCVCWGLENNYTKAISGKDTRQITVIKGCFSGLGGLVIAFAIGESFPVLKWIIISMLLGFVSYGISVCLYIYSQRWIGAGKTAAIYSIAPFFGVFLSICFLGERPHLQFYLSLVLMVIAVYLVIRDIFDRHNS